MQPTELCTLMIVEHGAVAGGDLLERQRIADMVGAAPP